MLKRRLNNNQVMDPINPPKPGRFENPYIERVDMINKGYLQKLRKDNKNRSALA